jgi:hypothetical protein
METGIDDLGSEFLNMYESFRLGTIHRYFRGNNVSLLAVFAVFEILHNIKDFVKMTVTDGGENFYAEKWYGDIISGLSEGEIPIHPVVYKYVFSKPFMTKRKIDRILKSAHKECMNILESTGLLSYIKKRLKEE